MQVKLDLSVGYIVNGNLFVPNDPTNRHYQEIQAWIDNGNTPEPAEVPTAEAAARTLEINQAGVIAKVFYASHPAVVAFIRDNTPAQREALIGAMTLAQLRVVITYLVEAVIADIKERYL